MMCPGCTGKCIIPLNYALCKTSCKVTLTSRLGSICWCPPSSSDNEPLLLCWLIFPSRRHLSNSLLILYLCLQAVTAAPFHETTGWARVSDLWRRTTSSWSVQRFQKNKPHLHLNLNQSSSAGCCCFLVWLWSQVGSSVAECVTLDKHGGTG